MKRRIWISALLLLLLTACGNHAGDWDDGDIVFINYSHVPVSSVSVSCEGETQGGQFADGSPLRKGDSLSFEMVNVPSVMTAYGQEGEELAACTLTERSETRWKVFLICSEDGELILIAEN